MVDVQIAKRFAKTSRATLQQLWHLSLDKHFRLYRSLLLYIRSGLKSACIGQRMIDATGQSPALCHEQLPPRKALGFQKDGFMYDDRVQEKRERCWAFGYYVVGLLLSAEASTIFRAIGSNIAKKDLMCSMNVFVLRDVIYSFNSEPIDSENVTTCVYMCQQRVIRSSMSIFIDIFEGYLSLQ